MNAAHPMESTRPLPVSTSVTRLERSAGFAGLAFALLVGAVNVIVGAMSPPSYNANAGEITAFLTENRTVMAIVSSVVPFAVVALFVFLASSFPILSKSSPEAAF